jgi:hypothetical protein
MALWAYGSMAPWHHGTMALWHYGSMALWLYGTMALAFTSSNGTNIALAQALRPYDLMAPWPYVYGLMALWPYGSMALWPYGSMALWLQHSLWPLGTSTGSTSYCHGSESQYHSNVSP